MTERARHWRRVLAAWRQSGVTQAAFCRREGISTATFYWWKRRLGGEGKGSACATRRAPHADRFVELRPAEAATASTGPAPLIGPVYEVVLAGGRTIRVGERFDPETLSRLIAAVEAAC